jgi:acyl dehydratase
MGELSEKPRLHRYEEIAEGARESRDYIISQTVYAAFLTAFADYSPIHVDETYAVACGFAGHVMHGTLLNGFLSHFVGMYFPGRLSLLLAVDLRFAQPCYLNDVIRLEAVVKQKMDARRVLVLDTIFTNQTRSCIAARGRVQVMLRTEDA